MDAPSRGGTDSHWRPFYGIFMNIFKQTRAVHCSSMNLHNNATNNSLKQDSYVRPDLGLENVG